MFKFSNFFLPNTMETKKITSVVLQFINIKMTLGEKSIFQCLKIPLQSRSLLYYSNPSSSSSASSLSLFLITQKPRPITATRRTPTKPLTT